MNFELSEDSLNNKISIQNLSETDKLYLKEIIESVVIDILSKDSPSGDF